MVIRLAGPSFQGIYQIQLDQTLKRLDEDLGINIMTSLVNTTVINKLSDAHFVRSDSLKLFYPLQSCSNVCGVIVVCMVAILCDH